MLGPLILLLLIADVGAGRVLVEPDRVRENAAGPKVLPGKIASALSIDPGHMDRAFALDETDHSRHRVFGRDQKQHVDMTGRQMPFLNLRVLLKRELAEYLAQMSAQLLIQRLPPTFRMKTT